MQDQSVYSQIATLIKDADILLLATGAGFSADSGLPVYGDIAKQPVYSEKGLTYADICSQNTLETNPAAFYGFFGHTANMYREVTPHRGYNIIQQWKELYFSKEQSSTVISEFNKEMKKKIESVSEECRMGNILLEHIPGPFFTYTSNVDGHFRTSGFDESEIEEMHGSIDFWQCANPSSCTTPITEGLWWWLPTQHKFQVQEDTMEAPNSESSDDCQYGLHSNMERPTGFQRSIEEIFGERSFRTNHPMCISCGGPARPNIVMFNDSNFIDGVETSHYLEWENVVSDLVERRGAKVVILEIGCGMKVPSIRVLTEQKLSEWPTSHLIRVNPVDTNYSFIEHTEDHNSRFTPVNSNGLSFLEAINSYL